MSQTQQPCHLLKTLEKKDRELTLEIQLLTAWIREHRALRPLRQDAPSLSPKSSELQSWRKTSTHLHQRRSKLKTKLENVRTHLRTAAQKNEAAETDFFCFPGFPDTDLESEPASADA